VTGSSSGGGQDVRVRPVRADEWETLRELRLRALAGAPDAFAGTHAEEAAVPEELWRRRAAGGPDVVTFVAVVHDGPAPPAGDRAGPAAASGGEAIGMATVRLEGREPLRGHLLGMWVDPAHRHRGVARALIDQVARWAGSRGAAELVLWVVDRNSAARRLYQRAGFEPTGERQPLPSRPELSESKLRRAL
jgi:ribosomal protein S18 acetylase RimI-like enzyme